MKAPQELNGIERNKDAYLFNIPSSAPSSPFSSPARSPQRIPRDIFTSRVFKSPTVFQAWSAPEMHPSDTNLGSAFSYQMSPEGKCAFSVESSPLHSPRVSPRRCSRSPGGPTSPNAHRLATSSGSHFTYKDTFRFSNRNAKKITVAEREAYRAWYFWKCLRCLQQVVNFSKLLIKIVIYSIRLD